MALTCFAYSTLLSGGASRVLAGTAGHIVTAVAPVLEVT